MKKVLEIEGKEMMNLIIILVIVATAIFTYNILMINKKRLKSLGKNGQQESLMQEVKMMNQCQCTGKIKK